MQISTHRITKHTLTHSTDQIIRAGKNYIILFISRGSCYVDINQTTIFCGTEDSIILKPNMTISLHYKNNQILLEYLVITLSPEYLQFLSDGDVQFEASLSFPQVDIAHTRLESTSAMLIKNIALQILLINSSPKEFGHELFEKNLYSLLLLQTIRSCIEADAVVKSSRRKKLIIDDIFAYISEHLTEELSLDKLSEEFYVSKYYICREFKRLTGLSIHSYITKTRLSQCCKYIEADMPIHEVYQLGGFGGYNHFFKAFKKEYHMSPKEYYKSLKLPEKPNLSSNVN